VTSPWEGCVNVRDLGGHPTEDGGTTRFGRVLRSDDLWHLTPAGRAAFAAAGVVRVVDLRTDAERLERAGDPGVEVVHVSIVGAWGEEDESRHNRRRDDAVDALEYLEWAYEEFLERHAARFVAAVAAVADTPLHGAAVVHCVAGKDRTGLVSALLLRLAGVPVDDVAADYAASEACLAPTHDAWVEQAPDAAEARRRRMLLYTPQEAMARTLARLEARHGDVAGYLAASGLPATAAARVRARLLDHRP
jgi:protein tyrosine/serine phosphatase